MFYLTGGGAWKNYKLSVSAPGGSVSDNETKTAWSIGGGAEWMFAPKWSAKLEYLYMDTGDTSVTLLGTTFTGHAQNNIVRVGVNYHF
jgi:outer membrane immunogenic protein